MVSADRDTACPMAFTLCAGIQATAQLTFLGTILMIRHDHLTAAEVPDGVFSQAIRRRVALAVALAASIPLAYVTHWAYAIWAAGPVLIRLAMLVGRRRGK